MTPRLRVALLILTAAGAASLRAQNADVQSERATYDGALLRMLRGATSPGTIAVWPQPLPASRSSTPTDAATTWARDYYGPLIDTTGFPAGTTVTPTVNGRTHLGMVVDSSLHLLVDGALMGRGGTTNDGSSGERYLLGRASVRVLGTLGDNLGFALDLSNGARLAGTSQTIARTDPTLGRTLKFVLEEQSFFDRYMGYVQYQGEHLRVRFGREPIQYGFSPIDNMVHSLQAAPMDGLLIDVPYKRVRFTSTHSLAEGLDTAGKAVPGKYVATHRLSVDPTDWLSVAVSDMIVYWNRGLDLAYLNPLAFFVSAGLGTEDRSRTDNSILGLDIAIRPIPGTMIYGSFIADDISYATLSDTSQRGNNNKYAWQLGVSQLVDSPSMPLLVSAEYARIDPFTFTHRSINASYAHLGAPVGYAMQPNSDRLAAQIRLWFGPRTSLRVDVDYTRHGENLRGADGGILMGEDPRYPGSGLMAPIGNVGGDLLRGDGDFLQGNRFLRGNVSHSRRIQAWFSGEVFTNVFTDLRLGYENRNGGYDAASFLFTSFEVRIGY